MFGKRGLEGLRRVSNCCVLSPTDLVLEASHLTDQAIVAAMLDAQIVDQIVDLAQSSRAFVVFAHRVDGLVGQWSVNCPLSRHTIDGLVD